MKVGEGDSKHLSGRVKLEPNLHLHANYGILNKGQVSFQARFTNLPAYGETVYKRNKLELFHVKGKLLLSVPNEKFLGRELRRFLGFYVRSVGGRPRSLNYWLVPYR